MLIDTYLPIYDVKKKHDILINATSASVYQSVCTVDLNSSLLIRLLFKLRGLPSKAMTLDELENLRFAKLGVVENREILLGLVGKFWTLGGHLQEINSKSFVDFKDSGYARAVWNFSLLEKGDGKTSLTTETRVQCTDRWSARFFKIYWLIISPFSGVIRSEILRMVKRDSELKARSIA